MEIWKVGMQDMLPFISVWLERLVFLQFHALLSMVPGSGDSTTGSLLTQCGKQKGSER